MGAAAGGQIAYCAVPCRATFGGNSLHHVGVLPPQADRFQ